MKEKKKDKILNNLANLILFLTVIIMMIPIYWMIVTSLKSPDQIFTYPPKLFIFKVTLSSFKEIFETQKFLYFFRNSLIVALLTTAVGVGFGIFGAYGFSKFNFKSRKTIFILLLTSLMFPWALNLLTIYIFFVRVRIINTHFGLVFAYQCIVLPVSIWLIKNYFDTIHTDITDSALLDGCSRVGVLFRILIPLSLPGIFSTAIFSFITGWNEYLFALTLTNTKFARTLPPGLHTHYMTFVRIGWNGLMAASLIATIPTLLLFLLFQKYFIKGLSAGAIKG